MIVLERVRESIIRRAPAAVCDDCITNSLGLTIRQHANHKTRELSKEPGFDRRKDVCATCGSIKEVIRLA